MELRFELRGRARLVHQLRIGSLPQPRLVPNVMHMPQANQAGVSEARARQTIAEYLRGLRDGSEEEQATPTQSRRESARTGGRSLYSPEEISQNFWKASLDGPIMLMWGNAFASGSERLSNRPARNTRPMTCHASCNRASFFFFCRGLQQEVHAGHEAALGQARPSLREVLVGQMLLVPGLGQDGLPGQEAPAMRPQPLAVPCTPLRVDAQRLRASMPKSSMLFMSLTSGSWTTRQNGLIAAPRTLSTRIWRQTQTTIRALDLSMLWMPGDRHFAPTIWCDCCKAGICRLWRRFSQWQAQGALRANVSLGAWAGPKRPKSLRQAYPLGCWELHLNPIHGGEQAALKAIKAQRAGRTGLCGTGDTTLPGF